MLADLYYSDRTKSAKILADYAEVKKQLEETMFECEEAENTLAVLKFDE